MKRFRRRLERGLRICPSLGAKKSKKSRWRKLRRFNLPDKPDVIRLEAGKPPICR